MDYTPFGLNNSGETFPIYLYLYLGIRVEIPSHTLYIVSQSHSNAVRRSICITPQQAEGAARGQRISLTFSTPEGVELIHSFDRIKRISTSSCAIPFHGLTHDEQPLTFFNLTT
jgi:hypothetical protein